MNELALVLEGLNSFANRTKRVEALETAMLKAPQVPCPVVHRFGPGIYIREVTIPRGSIAVGHHQNFPHICVMLKGKVTMLNPDQTTTEIEAPFIGTFPAGRKIGYMHEDNVWLNIYPTPEQDIEKLELHYLTKSDGWKADQSLRQGMKLLQSSIDVKDFAKTISEMGFTPDQVREISESTSDMTDLPYGSYKIKVGQSSIEGQGLFATADIEAGEVIAPSRILGKRTIAGRFTNHSVSPNAIMTRGPGNDIDLVALRAITGCHGGQDGEEITINYKDSVELTWSIIRSLK